MRYKILRMSLYQWKREEAGMSKRGAQQKEPWQSLWSTEKAHPPWPSLCRKGWFFNCKLLTKQRIAALVGDNLLWGTFSLTHFVRADSWQHPLTILPSGGSQVFLGREVWIHKCYLWIPRNGIAEREHGPLKHTQISYWQMAFQKDCTSFSQQFISLLRHEKYDTWNVLQLLLDDRILLLWILS